MATSLEPLVFSYVYDLLLKKDTTLAGVFKKKTNAAPLPKGNPTIFDVYKHYLSTSKRKFNYPKASKEDTSESSSESEEETAKPKPVIQNGKVQPKPAAGKKAESSSEDSSESDSAQKQPVAQPKGAPVKAGVQSKTQGKPAGKQESSSDDSSSEDEAPKPKLTQTKLNVSQVKTPLKPTQTPKKKRK